MRKILLVEDHARHRELLARRLTTKGFEVTVAENGNDVMAMALETNPDVVLMDIKLPGTDGHSATRALKNNEQTQSIPVIAISAYDAVEERRRSEASGCDEFEPKPVKLARLLSKIDRLCSR